MWLHHKACPGVTEKQQHCKTHAVFEASDVHTCGCNQTADCKCEFIMKGHITLCPDISVDGQMVDVVYYWTRWCIDLWWSGPVFGGLAMLFSSLSYPQHLYRWLQLRTDRCCNRQSDREKARLCPQNIISCLWEVWALLIKRLGWAAQIDCQDTVMSDWPGRREKLNPVMALYFFFFTVTFGSRNQTYHNLSKHKTTQCFSSGCWSVVEWVII